MSPHLNDKAWAVLTVLLQQTHAQPLEGLGQSMGLTALQVGVAVEQLRRAGCEIDAHPQRGVRLLKSGLGCWVDFIEPRHHARLGHRLRVYAHTASTQDIARRLVLDADACEQRDGWVVVADHQTAGRGRLGRRWLDHPGAQLLLTVIIAGQTYCTDRLMLAACHALAQTVEQATGLPVRVRWPNDLMIHGRKLAGILVETVKDAALIGIGLNVGVDPDTLAPPLDQLATSLSHQGCNLDRLLLLDGLLDQLHRAVHHVSDMQLHDAWRARSDMLQQRITVQQGERTLTGRVLDIDPLQGLLLEVERGPVVTLRAATTRLVLDPAL